MRFNFLSTLAFGTWVAIAAAQASIPSATGFTGPCATITSQLAGNGSLNATFDAGTTWDCMNSIPINSTDATQMIQWGQAYLNLISTLGWLKDPPPSYQRPGVDFMSELGNIASRINSTGSDALQSQLQIDLLLRNLTVRTRDGHNGFASRMLRSFLFNMNFTVVALSKNGFDTPHLYIYEDILKAGSGPGGQNQSFIPSAIKTLGGQEPIAYIQNFTNTNIAAGLLEEHTEFNNQMQNYVSQVGGSPSSFGKSRIYNGDTLSVTLENGTSFTANYTATTQCDFRAASSVEDIYSTCVLASATSAAPSAVPTDPSDGEDGPSDLDSDSAAQWSLKGPFPNPIVVQDVNIPPSAGLVTGYNLQDASIAVLSIPDFKANVLPNPKNYQTFSNAVGDFINKSIQAQMKNVVIDLTGNGGGQIFLGYDTFKRFFPDISPYIGYNVPSTPQWNAIGTAWTGLDANTSSEGESLPKDLNSPFVPFDAYQDIDDHGHVYTSWDQVAGPITDRSAKLTNSIQHAFNNSRVWGGLSDGQYQYIYGYGDRSNTTSRPWNPDQIVMLTDGQCGSTCAIFQELMKTQGVRSIVLGGLPTTLGPMQAVGGTRGSNAFPLENLAKTNDALRKQNLSNDIVSNLPAHAPSPRINVTVGEINARNMVRNGSDVALQFTYQAADCRLWYTIPMATDYTVLWKQVADVAFNNNTALCVQGSTGHPTAKANVTSTDDPFTSSSSSATPSGTSGSSGSSSTPKSMAGAGAVAQMAFVWFVVAFSCAFVLL